VGSLTNLSATQWDSKYSALYAESPPYQAASSFAAPLLLIEAVEAVGSLNSTAIMAHLRRPGSSSATFYGRVAFDAHMQNVADSSVVQHDGAGAAQVVFPLLSKTGDIVFPLPTWGYVECVHCVWRRCCSVVCVCGDL
jgi:hypothetical protein